MTEDTQKGTGLHGKITYQIIGAAQRVYRTLGTGFLEKVYENALCIELRELGLEVNQSMPIEVRYRGQVVGNFGADLLVGGVVIVELKAVEHLADVHEVQLVNFGPRFEVKRRILTNDRKET
jgi:GxxExxY protein